MVTTTGLDDAGLIPAGSIIERVYFATPDGYTAGPEFDTEREAIRAGAEQKQAAIRAAEAHAEATGGRCYVPERFSVDVRWLVRYPADARSVSSTDLVARRTTYETLEDARAHLARIERFTPAP